MKNEDLDDYELFYMELPQADYLKDIEIQDDYDQQNYDDFQGLSAEQVDQIARDSLGDADQGDSDGQADTNLLPNPDSH